MRVLVVTMPDGSKMSVSVDYIASNRAEFYARKAYEDADTIDPTLFDRVFKEEYDSVIADDKTIIDWAEGCIDWKEVKEVARPFKSAKPVDYQEGWVNGDKEIVEVSDKLYAPLEDNNED